MEEQLLLNLIKINDEIHVFSANDKDFIYEIEHSLGDKKIWISFYFPLHFPN